MTTRVHYKSGSGRAVEGELALPPGNGKAPTLILVQEWWGLNDHIRAYAERYAAEGFVTLAVDLYDGTTTSDRDEAAHRMNGLDWSAALDHIAGAIAHLKAHARSNGKVGITGFCMGGAVTLSAASNLGGLSAAVPFYGVPSSFDASHVEAPILGHVARRDTWVTPALAEKLAADLRAAHKHVEIELYDADHAFMNMARPEVYDAACANTAWTKTVVFLRQHLRA